MGRDHTAERKFWCCMESGEPPRLLGVKPAKSRIEAVRLVDMSRFWAEFADIFRSTRQAFLDRERCKEELKTLMPENRSTGIDPTVTARVPWKHTHCQQIRISLGL